MDNDQVRYEYTANDFNYLSDMLPEQQNLKEEDHYKMIFRIHHNKGSIGLKQAGNNSSERN